MKICTGKFEVIFRVRLNVETLNLVLKPQSDVFLANIICIIRVRVRGRIINCCDVIINLSTAVRNKILKLPGVNFHPPVWIRRNFIMLNK